MQESDIDFVAGQTGANPKMRTSMLTKIKRNLQMEQRELDQNWFEQDDDQKQV